MVQNLEGMGFTVVPMGQGFASMSPPTKELMKLTLEKKLAHGGHPVLRWNMVWITSSSVLTLPETSSSRPCDTLRKRCSRKRI